MGQHVRVRVAEQSPAERQQDAPEDQFSARNEPVHVITVADPHHAPPRRARMARARIQILDRRDLQVLRAPPGEPHRHAERLHGGRSRPYRPRRSRPSLVRAALMQLRAERLRRLHREERLARGRLPHGPVLDDAERGPDRDGRRGGEAEHRLMHRIRDDLRRSHSGRAASWIAMTRAAARLRSRRAARTPCAWRRRSRFS